MWTDRTVERKAARDPAFGLAAHQEVGSAAFARALLPTTVAVRLTGQGLRRLPAVVDGAAIAGALASASAPNSAGLVTLESPAEYEDVAFDQLARLGADVEALAPACLRARSSERAAAPAALHQADPQEAYPGKPRINGSRQGSLPCRRR
ncbi:WYL domain-containing protein [Streptomyces tendae]|uniref:WYL domain-containing protein n=1 Tax=Streptomyces tendae TaxID=1932 RepID=UPI0033CC9ED8